MKGLIFIRHAETDLAGTFCGHTDPPINARGRQQVNELLAHLASDSLDAIYSSDLRRAADTAAALADTFSVPYKTTPNLRELYFGEWEGLTWNEIENRDGDYARLWIESSPHLSAPNGESFAAFESRVLREVNRILHIAINKRIAVVTHAGVMRVVLSRLLSHTERQAWDLTKPHCSFFEYSGAPICSETTL